MAQGQRLRLGLLGVGRRGQGHLSAIEGLGDRYEFVAACDVNETNARAAQLPGISIYTDVREFFSKAKLDVVDIVTPAETHHLMAKLAAEYGVHMLIETPLAPTRALMDFIGEAAEKAGVHVEVGENMWRQPQGRLNRKALDAGLIGKVLRVSSFYESIGQLGCYHSMSLMQLYAGAQVEEVRGFTRRFEVEPVKSYSTSYAAEDWVQAILLFSNGVIGSCTYLSSWLTPLRSGHSHLFTIEGTSGFINGGRGVSDTLYRLENNEQVSYQLKTEALGKGEKEIPTRFYYETSPRVEYLNPFSDSPLNYADRWGVRDIIAIADELTSIHRTVTTKSKPDYGIARARRDQELSIAIHESARLDGRPVQIPLTEMTVWEKERHQELGTKWGGDPLKDVERLIR